MASEIKVNVNVSVTKGTFKDTIAPGQIAIDMAGAGGGNPGEVNIGTSEEDIAFGDITPGLIVMINLDLTNYVEWGPKSGGSMIVLGKLKPGQIAVFYLGGSVTIRAKANTAACNVLIKGYDA